MKNRIITIVIFAVAILACCLAIAFSFFSFDADKKMDYIQTQDVRAQSPQLVADLEAATLETLPSVVEKYQKENHKLSKNPASIFSVIPFRSPPL